MKLLQQITTIDERTLTFRGTQPNTLTLLRSVIQPSDHLSRRGHLRPRSTHIRLASDRIKLPYKTHTHREKQVRCAYKRNGMKWEEFRVVRRRLSAGQSAFERQPGNTISTTRNTSKLQKLRNFDSRSTLYLNFGMLNVGKTCRVFGKFVVIRRKVERKGVKVRRKFY